MEPKIKRILELIAEGKTDQEIADEFGNTRASISQYIVRLRKRGYEIPDRRKSVPTLAQDQLAASAASGIKPATATTNQGEQVATVAELEGKLRKALKKKPQTLEELGERAHVNYKALTRPMSNLVRQKEAVKVAGRPPSYRKP
jgi:biotin operon repressor